MNNLALDSIGLGGTRPASLDLSIPSDQELLKVPLNARKAQETGLLRLEPLEDRVRVGAVDVRLLHDGEADAIVDLAEGLNLVVGARVLTSELVAGKTEDGEVVAVLLADGGVELLEVKTRAPTTRFSPSARSTMASASPS